jgi:hypothetical protein
MNLSVKKFSSQARSHYRAASSEWYQGLVTEVTSIPKREVFFKFETLRRIASNLFNLQVSHAIEAMLT